MCFVIFMYTLFDVIFYGFERDYYYYENEFSKSEKLNSCMHS
jgi:hypothetical protein